MTALAPLVLAPRLVEVIWGGDTLVRRYGKTGDASARIGESWECFDGNRIARGPAAGSTLAEARARFGAALMGACPASDPFPLLAKFIDARDALSVQVHPGDAYARRVEGERNGKTECWYVLEARSGADLVLGWKREMSREEFVARVADGSLGEALRRVPVRAGDVFYLPAGTLHAIGAGIVLYELQQTSDLTYRIFDWNRVGADGKPRALHVERAADVLEYAAGQRDRIVPLRFDDGGAVRDMLVAGPAFTLELVHLDATPAVLDESAAPVVATALEHSVTIAAAGGACVLAPYETAVFAAERGPVTMRASGAAGRLLLGTSADGARLAARFARLGIDANSFLAQFKGATAQVGS